MQTYIVAMIVLVAGGTLIDTMHKKSGRYFFDHWRNARNKGTRQVGGGEMASLAIQTAAVEVLTSSEFCGVRRRIAHLLTMYGFLLYVVTTAIMVFAYPTPATPTPAILPALWYIGALMVCAVLVPLEGQTPSSSAKLAFLIPDLYGPGGLTLPNPDHEAHFDSSFQQNFGPFNSAVASQLSALPIPSSASGFTSKVIAGCATAVVATCR